MTMASSLPPGKSKYNRFLNMILLFNIETSHDLPTFGPVFPK